MEISRLEMDDLIDDLSRSNQSDYKERNISMVKDRYINSCTYSELGRRYSISTGRVRQIVVTYVRKLRLRFKKEV